MEEGLFVVDNINISIEAKLMSAALGTGCLVLGDEKGKLVSYEYDISGSKTMNFRQCEVYAIPKGKPEKIIIAPLINVAYVLINGEVHLFSLPKLKKEFELKHKETIVGMAVDSYNKIEALCLMVITKKKRLRFFSYDPDTKTLNETQPDKAIYVENIPEHYQWYDNILCYSFKNKVFWHNINTNTFETKDVDNIKGMQYCHQLLIYKDTSLMLGMNPKEECLTVNIKEKPIDFCDMKGYLIGINDIEGKSIYIYAHGNGEQYYNIVQPLYLNQSEKCKFIVKNTNQVMCIINIQGNNYRVIELIEKNIVDIITSLLKKHKYNEALNIINNSIVSSSEDKINLIHKFYLDVSWCALHNGNFNLSGELAQIVNSNPFEYIYIFSDLLYIRSSIDALNKNKEIHSIISNITSLEKESLSNAYTFLLNYLRNKRQYFLTKYSYIKDKDISLSFSSSEYSKLTTDLSKDKIKLKDILNVINATMIKLMIMLKIQHPTEMLNIFEHASCSLEGLFDFTEDQFYITDKAEWKSADTESKYQNTSHFKIAFAYYYEKKKLHDKAFSKWKELIMENIDALDSEIVIEGKEHIYKMFTWICNYDDRGNSQIRKKHQTLLIDNIKWIIDIMPSFSFQLAIDASSMKTPSEFSLMPIEVFNNEILIKKEKEKPELNLKEMFLAFYNELSPNEQYQTMLLECYIEKLFAKFGPKMKQEDIQAQFTDEIRKYYVSFMEVLKKKEACYKKEYILEKIKNSWLKQAEIYLRSELQKHNEVLDMLIEQIEIKKRASDDQNVNEREKNIELFESVEMYCNSYMKNKPDLFTDLFIKILQKYKNTNDKYKQIYKDELLYLLQKHGSVEKIDFLQVLENIPDDFNTCEKDFHAYLLNAIQEYIQLSNTIKFEKNISDMALLYKEKELNDLRDKGVLIDTNTVCDLCKKKIGSNIFVIYPNMRVFHENCANNDSICPVTGVDFTKRNYDI